MVSSAVTGMVQPVTKVAGSVGSQSGQDNSGNVDFARIMNSSVRNDVTGNSSKQTNTYSAAPSDSLVSMGANKSNKNADIVTYRMSTGFEAVMGYLHMTEEIERLEELIDWCVKRVEEATHENK